MPNKFHRQNFKFGGKSSIQKIAEAFGPKKKGKKKKMMAKKTETPMQKAVKKNKNKKRII